jgi:hypothetical protein
MSFGSNGVDWVRSLRKIQLQVFCSKSRYNGPPGRVSHRFLVENRNSENDNKHEFWVKRGGLGAFVAENSTASFFVPKVARTDLRASFAPLFRRKPKSRKRNNMSFGSNGVDWVRSLRKIQLQVFCSKSR